MTTKDGNDGNRTVFRPSPLAGLNAGKAQAETPAQTLAPQPAAAQSLPDDVVAPAGVIDARNRIMVEAGPVLALAASLRSGRIRPPLPQFHRQATDAISRFEKTIGGTVPDETFQRARYALCATVDDIAQTLPGQGTDTAEWARRSMVVTFFRENIGGDRFWQLVDLMLQAPAQNRDLIELYHACLAAGFEGRFRVMPDGRRLLQEKSSALFAALEHPRSLSRTELVPHWKGEAAPPAKVGFWNYIALFAAAAFGIMLLIYIVLRLILMTTGHPAWQSVSALMPDERLRLSREAVAPPAPSGTQASRLKTFLAPEIQQGLVVVTEDASTVRVRTTIGQLFKSGSDQLESGKAGLFQRIGKAVDTEPGPVTIEGHSDSDRISSLTFPDNMALSGARANTVAGILAGQLRDPSRITAQAFGDSQPIASNDSADGKAKNRRVEIVLQRQD